MRFAFTDGSCLKNGRVDASGGFGVVILDGQNEDIENASILDIQQTFTNGITTNNREEMKAILWVMYSYGDKLYEGHPITIYSDSQYAINTFTNWMWNWKKAGWKKADNMTPENLDLIQMFDKLKNLGYNINLKYIKGHTGNKWNELADQLATGKINLKEDKVIWKLSTQTNHALLNGV